MSSSISLNIRRSLLRYRSHLRHAQYSTFRQSPAPPRLPREEQERFEQLQRQSTGAFSTPRTPPQINQSPASQVAASPASPTSSEQNSADIASRINQPAINPSPQAANNGEQKEFSARIKTKGDGEELHPNVRRGAPPEFEGEINPKTGEVGGPKNEPLRWGHGGDWSYNGRVTDF